MSDTQPIRRAALLLTETRPGSDAEAAQMVKLYNLLVAWAANLAPDAKRARPKGYVYFIQATGGGPIKIGFSGKPADRMATLRTGAPFRLQLLASCPGAYHDERNLHEMFATARVRGEWFRATPELLAVIERVKIDGGLPWADEGSGSGNSGADIRI